MKTIQIPGSRNKQLRVECVNWGTDLYLNFTEAGDFKRDGGGDAFKNPLKKGKVPAKKFGPFTAPKKKIVVNWAFDSSVTGETTKGQISVEDDPSCKDK